MNLNELAAVACAPLRQQPDRYRVALQTDRSAVQLIDCGVAVDGGLEAGVLLAETCMAGLGRVSLAAGDPAIWSGPFVTVSSDHPVDACLAAQYAGWPISGGKYFAMGSGPMRQARGREKLFDTLGGSRPAPQVVGVLETRKLPPTEICQQIAAECQVAPGEVTLLIAPTASLAGGVQIVARSLETTLHKLHELHFPLEQIISGWGIAPLPPVAADDLHAIGRTNDAILYGGRVTLWVRGDDALIESVGPQVPSRASRDYGRPFAEIFAHYQHDFYRIDPLLFSPAEVHFVNVATGRSWRFGEAAPDIVAQSFRN